MKRFILIATLIGFNAYAQQHDIPFPDSNAVWIMETYIPPDPADPLQTSHVCRGQYFTHDTSMINGFTYHDLYLGHAFWGWSYVFDFLYEDFDQMVQLGIYIPIGKYRIEGNEVYYKPENAGNLQWCYWGYSFDQNDPYAEYLLYDFGLSVGDSFALDVNNNIVVQSIDSVLINGINYKRINFEDAIFWDGGGWGIYNYSWIEGIGSSIGFFPKFRNFEASISFKCFHEDEYSFSYYINGQNCAFTELQENKKYVLQAYPNPASEYLIIESSVKSETPGKLIDCVGNTILEFDLLGTKTQIEIEMLPSGFYYLSIDNSQYPIIIY